MLEESLSDVNKARHGLKVVMPRAKVPEGFDYWCKGGIPCFCIRGKFLNVSRFG